MLPPTAAALPAERSRKRDQPLSRKSRPCATCCPHPAGRSAHARRQRWRSEGSAVVPWCVPPCRRPSCAAAACRALIWISRYVTQPSCWRTSSAIRRSSGGGSSPTTVKPTPSSIQARAIDLLDRQARRCAGASGAEWSSAGLLLRRCVKRTGSVTPRAADVDPDIRGTAGV